MLSCCMPRQPKEMLLPSEILEEIFLHLDLTSLKACLSVSKYFRECILTSPHLMKRLPLKVSQRNWQSKLPFLERHGHTLRSVELRWTNASLEYLKFLHFTPFITTLLVDLTDLSSARTRATVDAEAAKLESALAKLRAVNFDDVFEFSELKDFRFHLYKVDPSVLINRMVGVRNLRRLDIHVSASAHVDYQAILQLLARQEKLRELELKVDKLDHLINEETVAHFKFSLARLTLVPSAYVENDYAWTNEFLMRQRRTLEELRLFCRRLEDELGAGICSLERLKRLTCYAIPSFFQSSDSDTNCIVMPTLTYLRCFCGNDNASFQELNIDKCLPNLKSLNVHFGFDHRFAGFHPDVKVECNLLAKLQNLTEFCIESCNQNALHHLASPNLLTLATCCEDALFDIGSWTHIGKSMPRLQTLVIERVDRQFMKFIIENCVKYVQKLRHLRKLVLKEFDADVLTLHVSEGKVTRAVGHSRGFVMLTTFEEELRRKFETFEMVVLSDDDYERLYEHQMCYFHMCGP